MKRLLLISNSTQHGSGYLEHCEAEVRDFFGSAVQRVLFVPYALHDRAGYAAACRKRMEEMGFAVDSIHEADDPRGAVREAQGMFIGGGNTFRLLNELYANDLLDTIRERVANGMPYMGTSAGSNVACATIQTTNDMPIVYPPSFHALALAPFNLNPHYIDPDPSSMHMGETRDTRLKEFHEMNDRPVVALREGAMIRVEGTEATLKGTTGGKLFRPGLPAKEISTGYRLDDLLA